MYSTANKGYLIADNVDTDSVLVSKTKVQPADQPAWTSFEIKEFNVGLMRNLAPYIPGEGYVTKDKISLNPEAATNSKYIAGTDIYCLTPENPNGQVITLGNTVEERGIFRHRSSFNDISTRTDLVLIGGHSFANDTKYDISSLNNVILRKNNFFKNITPHLQAGDSPFQAEVTAGTAKCLVHDNTADVPYYQIAWNNNSTEQKANKFYSFFVKWDPTNSPLDAGNDKFTVNEYFIGRYTGPHYDYSIETGITQDGNLYIQTRINTVLNKNTNTDTNYIETTGLSLNDNQWHHIVVQLKPGQDDNYHVYVDGVLVIAEHVNFINIIDSTIIWNSSHIFDIAPKYQRVANSQKAPNGFKFAQLETYFGEYIPIDHEDILCKRNPDGTSNAQADVNVVFDISTNGLTSAPEVIYKPLETKLESSLTPDSSTEDYIESDIVSFSIEKNGIANDPNLETYLFNADGANDSDYYQYNYPMYDRLILSYDKETSKIGRAFKQRITSKLGDVVVSPIENLLKI